MSASANSTSTSCPNASQTVPCATSNDDGWKWLNSSHRSVLAHELGYPLFLSLNQNYCEEKNENGALLPLLEREDEHVDENLEFLFLNSFQNWNQNKNDSQDTESGDIPKVVQNERRLTEFFAQELDQVGMEMNWKAKTVVHVGSKVNADLILSTKDSVPLVVIELGLKDSDWWAKVGQGSMYLQQMINPGPATSTYKFTKPILLVIATLKTKKSVTIDNDSRATFQQGRLGIFLCWLKGDEGRIGNKIRSTLLWRKEIDNEMSCTKKLSEYSEAIGRSLLAAKNLAMWRDNPSSGSPLTFKSLGPNCCLISTNEATEGKEGTYRVIRTYDNRFRNTGRNTFMYKILHEKLSSAFPDCPYRKLHYLATYQDINYNQHEFEYGQAPPETFVDNNNWIWGFVGKVTLIETDYIHGTHWPETAGDFIPIVDDLLHLHKLGFVHGDIRLFNMVFLKLDSGAIEAYLIDFDLGGIAGEAKYPPGYTAFLVDSEDRVNPGDEIKQSHDWYYLVSLIVNKHILKPPVEVSKEDTSKNENDTFLEKFVDLYDTSDFECLFDTVESFREYLIRIKDWTCTPKSRSLRRLKRKDDYKHESTGSPRRALN